MIDATLAFITGAWIAMFAFPILWITLIVWFGIMIWLTEDESYFFASVLMVAFIWGLSAVSNNGISFSLLDTLKYGALYFVVGSGWSFIKWVSFLFKKRDLLKKLKVEFLTKYDGINRSINNLSFGGRPKPHHDDDDSVWDFQNATYTTPVPEELQEDYFHYLNQKNYLGSYSRVESMDGVTPNIADYKGKVVHWIVWWPFSAFWTLLDDPIRRIAEWCYRSLAGIYRKLANKAFDDFN